HPPSPPHRPAQVTAPSSLLSAWPPGALRRASPSFGLASPFGPAHPGVMSMDRYYLLGRSGLRVSRLALGTMNFGTGGFHAAYGKTRDEARAVFRRYTDAGGNFIDTADFYTAGQSETILGELIAEAKAGDRRG